MSSNEPLVGALSASEADLVRRAIAAAGNAHAIAEAAQVHRYAVERAAAQLPVRATTRLAVLAAARKIIQ